MNRKEISMTNKNYILGKNHELIETDLLTWARFFEDIKNRRVAEDIIDGVRISTVFLGIDHNFGNGEPLLFETMIFGGDNYDYQERYATWTEAEAGHQRAIELVKESHTKK